MGTLASIGMVMIYIGLVVFSIGISSDLNKRIENNSGRNLELQTLIFNEGFIDNDGKKIEPLTVLTFKEKEK